MAMKGYLVLENGKVFCGKRFGAAGDVTAEVVFTTGMVGYLGTLTDPGNAGQIVVQTFPLIGNYGVIPPDFESEHMGPKAYIVKEWCQVPSNFRSEGNLDAFFVERGLVGLSGIDTRALTKMIRETGSLRGCITDQPDQVDLAALKAWRSEAKVAEVSTKAPYTIKAKGERHKLALLDFGVKASVLHELAERGCTVTVLPHDTAPEEVLSLSPGGIVFSDGPGDPRENARIVENLKVLVKAGIPIFGMGLGHQLLALAKGFAVEKLPCGHRGANQPVKHLPTGRVYISAQNHQYAVKEGRVKGAEILFAHAGDQSCEGIRYLDSPAFSVQFQPESGPRDTKFLFDDFIKMMEGK